MADRLARVELDHQVRLHLNRVRHIAEARYARAGDIARMAVPEAQARRTLSEKLDRLTLHPILGIPLFLALVLLVFRLTFSVASPFVDLIGGPRLETNPAHCIAFRPKGA